MGWSAPTLPGWLDSHCASWCLIGGQRPVPPPNHHQFLIGFCKLPGTVNKTLLKVYIRNMPPFSTFVWPLLPLHERILEMWLSRVAIRPYLKKSQKWPEDASNLIEQVETLPSLPFACDFLRGGGARVLKKCGRVMEEWKELHQYIASYGLGWIRKGWCQCNKPYISLYLSLTGMDTLCAWRSCISSI